MAQAIHKLPRQPIPPLADTLDACVSSVSPMLNSLQRLKSKLVFEIYGAAQAKQQQRLLALAREQPINWCAAGLTQLWLSCRGGLPFSNNYVLQLEGDPQVESYTERAARLIVAALKLYQAILVESLSPDVADDMPLEMDQYRRCFATHRVPHLHCDEVVTATGSRHIAVLIDGHAHYMGVDLQHGTTSVAAVQNALDRIVDAVHTPNDNAMAPGMLSALPRDTWAEQRGELLKDRQNQQTLFLLEKALFVVCLDIDTAPGSLGGLSANLRDGNCHNRFYDKSMQIIVTENGKAGLCFERAAVDGSVALGFAARLQRESLSLPADCLETTPPCPTIKTRALSWSPSNALKRKMYAAHKFIVEARNRRGVEAWTTPNIGARRLKALDISPDAVVQFAIQLATHDVTGEVPNIFEPVQIRHFSGGRMDFIAPVTAESLAAVRSLRTRNTNQYFVAGKIRRAAKAHQQLVLHTKSGRGQVAHLLALNAVQAEDASHDGAGMYSWRQTMLSHLDKGLQMLTRQDVLAANGSGYAGIASFGPIGPRPDMLSIGYMIKDDEITFDLRADGRYSDHARALRTAVEKGLATIEKILANCINGELR